MPFLILITVIIGSAIAIMVHFLHMAIMWLRDWPSIRTVTSEYFMNRIFSGIISALLGCQPGITNRAIFYKICLITIKYVGLGYNIGGENKDFWEYDPPTDQWTSS
jgi:hypothetical protein